MCRMKIYFILIITNSINSNKYFVFCLRGHCVQKECSIVADAGKCPRIACTPIDGLDWVFEFISLNERIDIALLILFFALSLSLITMVKCEMVFICSLVFRVLTCRSSKPKYVVRRHLDLGCGRHAGELIQVHECCCVAGEQKLVVAPVVLYLVNPMALVLLSV